MNNTNNLETKDIFNNNNVQKSSNNETESIKSSKKESKNEAINYNGDSSNESQRKQNENSNSTNCCINCCRASGFEIFRNLLELIANLSIILNAISAIGLTVANNKNEDCKAEIKSKMQIIIIFCYALVFTYSLHTFLKEYIAKREDRDSISCCLGIFALIIKICNLGITIASLVICHKYYNLSNNWENCGSIKGWLIYNFIALYFDFVMFFLIVIIMLILALVGILGK